MSKYLDKAQEILNRGREATKKELSQLVGLTTLLVGDEWEMGLDIMEAVAVMVGNRPDISEEEYERLMEGDAIADFDLLEGI
jgi:hypothetical protein